MKICPKCGDEHQKKGVYCSRPCANSRIFTEEAKRKKSIANKKYYENLSDEEKAKKTSLLFKYSPYKSENYLESLMTQDWNVIGIQGKRLRVILEQDGSCNKCGLAEWIGTPITLEYEHKNGDRDDNKRNNVECLCPNCHSQTPTWRGRKNGNEQARVQKYLNMLP